MVSDYLADMVYKNIANLISPQYLFRDTRPLDLLILPRSRSVFPLRLLYPNIMQYSNYGISITATSVDPDSGDANDGSGTAPFVYSDTVIVTVPEPGQALLASVSLLLLVGLRRLEPRA